MHYDDDDVAFSVHDDDDDHIIPGAFYIACTQMMHAQCVYVRALQQQQQQQLVCMPHVHSLLPLLCEQNMQFVCMNAAAQSACVCNWGGVTNVAVWSMRALRVTRAVLCVCAD